MTSYLDSHVAIWLIGDKSKLTDAAIEVIDNDDLLISPMVLLEFQYLSYRNVIEIAPDQLLGLLHREYGVALCSHPFPAIIREALALDWTRDPFDRIIAGHAMATKSKLVTADREIRTHYDQAVW